MSRENPPAATGPVRRFSRISGRRLCLYSFWLAVACLVLVWGWPDIERVFRVGGTLLFGGLAGILLGLWFFLFSGWSRRVKFITATALALFVVVAIALLRVKEFSGDVVPILTWRWTPVSDQTLQTAPSEQIAAQPLKFPHGSRATDAPRFLGSDGRGEIHGLKLETDWEKHPPREVWKIPMGAGWGGFAVVGNYAITQEQRGAQECVNCYDVNNGKLLWSHQDVVRFSEVLGGDGPRATPTIEDGRVYALGATGILNCLEGETGKSVWTRDTLKELGQLNLEWGKSSSPLIVENLVIISLGKPLPEVAKTLPSLSDGLAAFHRDTGKLVWKAGQDYACYSSPVLAKFAGMPQVLSLNATSLSAHDPHTGWILWSHPWPGTHPKCSNPFVIEGDRVLLSAGYGLGGMLLKVTRTGNARWKIEEQWRSRQLKTRFTNVVLRDDSIYGLDDGILCCVDVETGKTRWRNGRYSHGQILLVEDLLLVQAENGDLALVRADPHAYKELARVPALTGKTWNNPTLCGNRLLVRNAEQAICFELALRDPSRQAQ